MLENGRTRGMHWLVLFKKAVNLVGWNLETGACRMSAPLYPRKYTQTQILAEVCMEPVQPRKPAREKITGSKAKLKWSAASEMAEWLSINTELGKTDGHSWIGGDYQGFKVDSSERLRAGYHWAYMDQPQQYHVPDTCLESFNRTSHGWMQGWRLTPPNQETSPLLKGSWPKGFSYIRSKYQQYWRNPSKPLEGNMRHISKMVTRFRSKGKTWSEAGKASRSQGNMFPGKLKLWCLQFGLIPPPDVATKHLWHPLHKSWEDEELLREELIMRFSVWAT